MPRISWPTGLVAAMVTLLGLQFSLMAYGANRFEGPDDPDYYQNGLDYAQVMRRQAALDWRLRVDADHLRAGRLNPVGLQVLGPHGEELPCHLQARLGRPATLSEDRALPVQNGQVQLRAAAGLWDLRVTARLNGHQREFRQRLKVMP